VDFIRGMYHHENVIRGKQLTGEAKMAYRLKLIEAIVQTFWLWCDQQCKRHDLRPTNQLTKALKYALERSEQLKVFE